mgnify:CR=1 FL=1
MMFKDFFFKYRKNFETPEITLLQKKQGLASSRFVNDFDGQVVDQPENGEKGFNYFAELCGYSLALAHCRGDRRSTRFSSSAAKTFESVKTLLVKVANLYAEQVIEDHALFKQHIENK